ncbi:unnamed protein product, partial [Prunus brigantina]
FLSLPVFSRPRLPLSLRFRSTGHGKGRHRSQTNQAPPSFLPRLFPAAGTAGFGRNLLEKAPVFDGTLEPPFSFVSQPIWTHKVLRPRILSRQLGIISSSRLERAAEPRLVLFPHELQYLSFLKALCYVLRPRILGRQLGIISSSRLERAAEPRLVLFPHELQYLSFLKALCYVNLLNFLPTCKLRLYSVRCSVIA